MRRSQLLVIALVGVLLLWGAVSLTETWPLDSPIAAEQLDGWQVALAVAGIALFALAAAGYFRIYRRRGATFVFAVTFALALLAEAMVVIAWARNWRVSWWEWHVLMLVAFVAIAVAARREWHEERFSALYLDETLAGARDVSILFADLAGFTPFAERHSPEEVTAMLNAYFGRIIPLMERSGGEVHQVDRRRGHGDLQQGRGSPRPRGGGRAAPRRRSRHGSGGRARPSRLAALPRRRQQRRGARGRRRGALVDTASTASSATRSTSQPGFRPRRPWGRSWSGRRRFAVCRRARWSSGCPSCA